MEKDPKQYTNLAYNSNYIDIVNDFSIKLRNKLVEVRTNDINVTTMKRKLKKVPGDKYK
jgi:hypothetical protein